MIVIFHLSPPSSFVSVQLPLTLLRAVKDQSMVGCPHLDDRSPRSDRLSKEISVLILTTLQMVELKSGDSYNGTLVAIDHLMNLHLKDVTWTSADGQKFWRARCPARCSNSKGSSSPAPPSHPPFLIAVERMLCSRQLHQIFPCP